MKIFSFYNPLVLVLRCKKLKNFRQPTYTTQENPIDSIRKLKLLNPHKNMLGHLNVNSL